MASYMQLLFLLCYSSAVRVPFNMHNDELLTSTLVTVTPDKAKVVEGAPAIFICHVSSIESDVHVTWQRNGRPITSGDDQLVVHNRVMESSTYQSISVLRITKTSKRGHKGKYKCHATGSDSGNSASDWGQLVVMKDTGAAGLTFGWLPPEVHVVQDPEPVVMMCSAMYKGRQIEGATFWIKNDTYEVALTPGFKSGRIMVQRSGALEMSYFEPGDSGVYECVAQHPKNKMLIISHEVTLVVKPRENRTQCTDRDGSYVALGDDYRPNDPCEVCTCLPDPYVTACSNETCRRPSCNDYTVVAGTCCDYTCHDERQSSCRDMYGEEVALGQHYHPFHDDPCTVCECLDDPEAMSCSNDACEEPTCENYSVILGTCCEFTCPDEEKNDMCEGFDGHAVSKGDVYHPYADRPCSICVCSPGTTPMTCSIAGCDIPDCNSYKWVDGTFCDHICSDDLNVVTLDVRQVGADGVIIQWDEDVLLAKALAVRYWDRFAVDRSTSFKVVNVTSGNAYAVVRGLSPNTMYEAHVQGTNLTGADFVGYARFSIQVRSTTGGNSLRLSDDDYPDIMIKMNGEAFPVVNWPGPGRQMYINMANFLYVLEGTFPCKRYSGVCPSLEFYGLDGKEVQVIQFYRQKDFVWARAHL